MRLEPKPAPSIAATLLYPIAAVVLTLAITALLVLAAGASPFSVFYLVWRGAAGSQFALLETLTRATPLIFTGLAVAVAFRAKLWNIGAEAQLYIGGVVTVVLGTGALPLPSFLLIPIIMVAAMAAGAALLLGPAVLKTRFGVDEVVTTLLLNFIVLLFVSMLLEGPLKDPMGLGWPQSPKVIAEAQLPRIIQGKRLHYGFVMALVSAAHRLGHHEEDHARLRDARRRPQSAGGFLRRHSGQLGADEDSASFRWPCCACRVLEVSGLKGNLTLDLSPGYGYSGIVVAMLAMLNPIGVVASAIFVAGIFVGADAMSRAAKVPSYIADVMVATSLLTMVVAILFTRYRLRWK